MTQLVLCYLLGRPLACPPHLLGSHQALPSLSSTSLLHPHCRPPSHLGSSTRPVPQGTTGTALAPGSGHLLLWDPCSHPGAAGLGCQTQGSVQCGNRRAHQGEDLLPQEKQSSRWLGQLVFETLQLWKQKLSNRALAQFASWYPSAGHRQTQLLPAHVSCPVVPSCAAKEKRLLC